MTDVPQNQLRTTYEREIERKPLNKIIFYIGFATVVFFIMFIFGIRPTAVALTQNLRYKSELEEIRQNMETKITQIQTFQRIITEKSTAVTALNDAIPNGTNLQQFVSELVGQASSAGFSVERVREIESDGRGVQVEIDMNGTLSQVDNLMTNMEEMQRFVTILDTRINVENGVASVKIRAEIYKL